MATPSTGKRQTLTHKEFALLVDCVRTNIDGVNRQRGWTGARDFLKAKMKEQGTELRCLSEWAVREACEIVKTAPLLATRGTGTVGKKLREDLDKAKADLEALAGATATSLHLMVTKADCMAAIAEHLKPVLADLATLRQAVTTLYSRAGIRPPVTFSDNNGTAVVNHNQ